MEPDQFFHREIRINISSSFLHPSSPWSLHLHTYCYSLTQHRATCFRIWTSATSSSSALTVLVTPKNLPFLSPLLSTHPSVQTLVLPTPISRWASRTSVTSVTSATSPSSPPSASPLPSGSPPTPTLPWPASLSTSSVGPSTWPTNSASTGSLDCPGTEPDRLYRYGSTTRWSGAWFQKLGTGPSCPLPDSWVGSDPIGN